MAEQTRQWLRVVDGEYYQVMLKDGRRLIVKLRFDIQGVYPLHGEVWFLDGREIAAITNHDVKPTETN